MRLPAEAGRLVSLCRRRKRGQDTNERRELGVSELPRRAFTGGRNEKACVRCAGGGIDDDGDGDGGGGVGGILNLGGSIDFTI